MKKIMLKYVKLWVLMIVAGGGFLLSSYTSQPDLSNDPCYRDGSISWDGYNCICRPEFTGKCCEVELDPNTGETISHARCRWPW